MHLGASIAQDLPPGTGWLSLVVLAILYVAAVIDSQTGRIPDKLIFAGMLIVVVVEGVWGDWPLAAQQLFFGFVAAIALWGLNQIYYHINGYDALGLGDAKWTALAVMVFGFKIVAFAWVSGAWLALLWIGIRWGVFKVRRQKEENDYVHFAGFLFVDLLGTLYWFYFR